MPKISIIIRAYNEEKHIGKLLKGIQQQSLDSEVILVDSGSTDQTVSIAEKYGVKIVRLSPDEFSFGYALNLGCEVASGEFLVFASAHVYPVYVDWLEQMVAPFSNKRTALVYGKQRGNEMNKYSEHQLFKRWFPDTSDLRQQHPFCNNANVAIRRELWEAQPYDEQLTGLEDLDWATKIMSKGYHIAYNADATIIHVHEETPRKILNRYRREAIALKKIMKREKFSFLTFLRLFIANFISDWAHALQEGVWLKHAGDIVMFRFMQFWGTYLGFRDKTADKTLRQRFYYPNALVRSNQPSKLNQQEVKYD